MKSNSLMIRPYKAADKTGCMEAFNSNVPKYFTTDEVHDFERFLTNLEVPENNNDLFYYTMMLNYRVIGCGGFCKKEETNAITFAWGLVHHDYHKQGFGKQLVAFRLEKIKLIYPDKQVILDTTQHSFPFFEKYGFETVKITNDFYAKGMHRYDMVFST